MPTLDDEWARIYPALEELKLTYIANPGEPWTERRQLFLGKLDIVDPALDPVAELLVDWLDELTDDDRNSLLSNEALNKESYERLKKYTDQRDQLAAAAAPAYEEAIPEAPGDPTYEETSATLDNTAYDANAWDVYLATNGTAWDGAAASWSQFREWFLYYATEQGLAFPATGFLLAFDGKTPGERIAGFADYGITIRPSGPSGAATAATDPPVVSADEPALSADEDTADEDTNALMEELLAENPEFAEISEQRRLELIAEVLSEEQPEAAAT
jgi:hypothetical protein